MHSHGDPVLYPWRLFTGCQLNVDSWIMAKQRFINTKFWSDSWIRKLNPLDRYLFLYLMTNEHSNVAGVYEIPIDIMAFETGIDEAELKRSMLGKLAPKIYFIENWIYITNFQKYQNLKNDNIKKGIEEVIKLIPENIKSKIQEINKTLQDSLRVSETLPTPPNNFNFNFNSNFDSNFNSLADHRSAGEIPKIINLFKEISPNSYKNWFGNTSERKASQKLLELHPLKDYEVLLGDLLPKINTMPYVSKDSKAFKPSELLRNLDKILSKIKEENLKAGKNIGVVKV